MSTGVERHWLWVTKPEYYAENDGSDRRDLDPTIAADTGDWWTCHKDTRAGDLILMYRTRPRMDLGYLVQAASDAYYIGDRPDARKAGWKYGCEYQVLLKLTPPIALAELRADPAMASWGALRANFQGSVHAVPDDVWSALMARIDARPRLKSGKTVRQAITDGKKSIATEKELQEWLHREPGVLARFGIHVDKLEKEVHCPGHRGRIDLLGYDRKARRTVVIELKVRRAGTNTYGQIRGYVNWARSQPQIQQPVWGVVIADGFDQPFKFANARSDGGSEFGVIEVAELGIELQH
jgi:hypothetical protein